MRRLNSFAHDTDGAVIAAAVSADGYAIVRDMLPADTLTRLRTELQPHLDAAEGGKEAFMGARTKRIGALLARSAVIELQRERAAAWIALYRSLGGGWTPAGAVPAALNQNPPTPSAPP